MSQEDQMELYSSKEKTPMLDNNYTEFCEELTKKIFKDFPDRTNNIDHGLTEIAIKYAQWAYDWSSDK